MPWDDDKSTASDPDNPTADEQLTADEWDAHVADQKNHSGRHESGGSDSLNVFDLVGTLTGAGLERVGDTLQVLSSIWDGSNIVADVDNDSVTTKQIGNDHHYAAAYDGDDADARLDAAFTDVSNGDTVYLESANYSDDRTLPNNIKLVGTGVRDSRDMTNITQGTIWTSSGAISAYSIGVNGELVLDQNYSRGYDLMGVGDITANEDEAVIVGCWGISITFSSGTADGIVDGCTNVSVTDNGSNTVGDIT